MKRLLVALILLLAAACHRIDRGVVVDKLHEPAHTYTTMECFSHDSRTGGCTMYLPQTHRVPDRWYVVLRGMDTKGRTRVEKFQSTAQTFYWAKSGDSCDASSGHLLCSRGVPGEGLVAEASY